MAKVKIGKDVFLPMPVVLVGTVVRGTPNFMAVGWASRVNYRPPLVGIAVFKSHHTAAGIRRNRTFSVCIPGTDLVTETDYCGLVSGKRTDKSKLFDVFYGDTKTAPMIEQAPLCFECRLVRTVSLPADYLYIGEIVAAYADRRVLTNGRPDYAKLGAFVLTMPDNRYRALGRTVAAAYSIGKKLMPRRSPRARG